ncbi:extracellular solute-binding protein, partial [Bacillus sp. S34]|nr:extracellular solute-binding protein [Bacillus sp. S34]
LNRATDVLMGGKVAFKNDGTFFVNGLKDVDFDWGVAPIPGSIAGDTASFAGGDNLAVPSGSKNKDGAWQFLK